jgi:hypothetical protein
MIREDGHMNVVDKDRVYTDSDLSQCAALTLSWGVRKTTKIIIRFSSGSNVREHLMSPPMSVCHAFFFRNNGTRGPIV